MKYGTTYALVGEKGHATFFGDTATAFYPHRYTSLPVLVLFIPYSSFALPFRRHYTTCSVHSSLSTGLLLKHLHIDNEEGDLFWNKHKNIYFAHVCFMLCSPGWYPGKATILRSHSFFPQTNLWETHSKFFWEMKKIPQIREKIGIPQNFPIIDWSMGKNLWDQWIVAQRLYSCGPVGKDILSKTRLRT